MYKNVNGMVYSVVNELLMVNSDIQEQHTRQRHMGHTNWGTLIFPTVLLLIFVHGYGLLQSTELM